MHKKSPPPFNELVLPGQLQPQLPTANMAFGILEDHHMELVPGTGKLYTASRKIAKLTQIAACMNDQSDVPREYEQVPRELLKHATGRLSHVILVPQPSDSPNDPLNVGTKLFLEIKALSWRIVVNLEERCHPSNRWPLRRSRWSLRPHALPRLCPNRP